MSKHRLTLDPTETREVYWALDAWQEECEDTAEGSGDLARALMNRVDRLVRRDERNNRKDTDG